MFEFFFDYDSFDFADTLTLAADNLSPDVVEPSDMPTTSLDAGSVSADPVGDGASDGQMPPVPMNPTDADQGSVPVEGDGGADGDVAIVLDDFSLFNLDVFA